MGVKASGHTIREFFWTGKDIVAAVDDTGAFGIPASWVAEPAMSESHLASRDPHFDLAAHDFLIFLDRSLEGFFERTKIVDIAGEALGLAAESDIETIFGQTIEGGDATFLGEQVRPKRIEVASKRTNHPHTGNNDALARFGHYQELSQVKKEIPEDPRFSSITGRIGFDNQR